MGTEDGADFFGQAEGEALLPNPSSSQAGCAP